MHTRVPAPIPPTPPPLHPTPTSPLPSHPAPRPQWALYHARNRLWGHFGSGRGAFHVSLSGATGNTSTASYGIGPQHQDLAVHQDALILNYHSPNHFGVTGFSVPAGYTRLYGPWLTLLAAGDPAQPDAMLAAAGAAAEAEIAASLGGLAWMDHPLYAPPSGRCNVTGAVAVTGADSAAPGPLYVVLTPGAGGQTDVYHVREPTYWAVSDASGRFSVPGVPAGGAYTLLAFSRGGGVVGTFSQGGVVVPGGGGATDLGTLAWRPPAAGLTTLWVVGDADQEGGEFRLGNHSREYGLPGDVPASTTFTVGASDPAADWYYAQTQAGTWEIRFTSAVAYTGTAHLFVSASLQQGGTPSVTLNGTPLTGSMPTGNDSTLSRQAVRSGHPELAVLTVPAAAIVVGQNSMRFTRGAAGAGMGWDVVTLAVDAQG